jgi:hypothetical protein
MILTPKNVRFVANAMRFADMPARAVWEAVDKDTSKDLPAAAERAALSALCAFEKALRARLKTLADEDEIADVSNDLGTVRAIERGLQRDLRQHAMAAAD